MTADDAGNGRGRDGGERDAGARRRWGLRVAAGAAAVAVLAAVGRVLAPGASDTDANGHRPVLHRWDLVGCYDLRVGPWRVSWRGDSAGDRRASGGSEEVPASFRPPAQLMLLPDSVDRWGRTLPSRRAVPLDGGEHPGRSLRWTVHADTLWLVWSEADTRAGVALRRAGDSIVGRIRTVRAADSLDATAPARARRINCWTRAPEPGSGRPIDRR